MAAELSGAEYWDSRINKLKVQFKQRYKNAKNNLAKKTKYQQNLFDGLRFHINGLLEIGFETAVQMIIEQSYQPTRTVFKNEYP